MFFIFLLILTPSGMMSLNKVYSLTTVVTLPSKQASWT